MIKQKAPTLEGFDAIEKQLKKEQPKPRKSFENALKKRLHRRYMELQEQREMESDKAFQSFGSWMRKWTLVPVALLLLIVVLGGGIYMTSPVPTATYESFSALNTSIQPSLAPVVIAFDTPMRESSVEEAFSIIPATDGRFIWNEEGTTLYFLPAIAFNEETAYQITISDQAKSRYFKSLAFDYDQTFTSKVFALTETDMRDFVSYNNNAGATGGGGYFPTDATSLAILSEPAPAAPQFELGALADKDEDENEPITEEGEIEMKIKDPFETLRTGDGPLTEQEFIQFEAALTVMEGKIEDRLISN